MVEIFNFLKPTLNWIGVIFRMKPRLVNCTLAGGNTLQGELNFMEKVRLSADCVLIKICKRS